MWDPAQYLRFDAERSRPFFDLLGQVDAEPSRVVDLGCGAGNLTVTLLERWPQASVLGIDNSPEMIAAAGAHAVAGRLEFELGDLAAWEPDWPVGVIVSNAVLQWVPGHRRLIPVLAGFLSEGGTLAFQVPGNFDQPSHTILRSLRTSARWADRLREGADRGASVADPGDYLADLHDAGLVPTVWETTYLQVLPGEDPVLEWMKGTALRPVLAALGEEDGGRFCEEMAPLLRSAYPPGPAGTVLPFRRIFAVGRRR